MGLIKRIKQRAKLLRAAWFSPLPSKPNSNAKSSPTTRSEKHGQKPPRTIEVSAKFDLDDPDPKPEGNTLVSLGVPGTTTFAPPVYTHEEAPVVSEHYFTDSSGKSVGYAFTRTRMRLYISDRDLANATHDGVITLLVRAQGVDFVIKVANSPKLWEGGTLRILTGCSEIPGIGAGCVLSAGVVDDDVFVSGEKLDQSVFPWI